MARFTQKFLKDSGKKGSVFNLDLIIIPMHIDGTHWCCGCINVKQKRIELYDSAGISEHSFYDRCKKWLAKEAELIGGSFTFNPDEWDAVDGRCPRQGNLFDCGVFAAQVMLQLAMGKGMGSEFPFAFPFVQADMETLRMRMAHEIKTNALLPPPA